MLIFVSEKSAITFGEGCTYNHMLYIIYKTEELLLLSWFPSNNSVCQHAVINIYSPPLY